MGTKTPFYQLFSRVSNKKCGESGTADENVCRAGDGQLELRFGKPVDSDDDGPGWKMFYASAIVGDYYRVTGRIMVSPEPGNVMAVRLVQVAPEFLRRGVARFLYQNVIQYAKSQGAKELVSDPEGGTKETLFGLWRSLGATEHPGEPSQFRLKLDNASPDRVSNKKCGDSGTSEGNVCHVGEGIPKAEFKDITNAIIDHNPAVKAGGIKVAIVPSDKSVGVGEIGGLTYEDAGTFDLNKKIIRSHPEASILAHESGHAGIYFALGKEHWNLGMLGVMQEDHPDHKLNLRGKLDPVKPNESQPAQFVWKDHSNLLESEKDVEGYWRYKTPSNQSEEVHNNLMDFIASFKSREDYPTVYTQLYVDHPEIVSGYDDRYVKDGDGQTIRFKGKIPRAADEAYAEFNAGLAVKHLSGHHALTARDQSYKFDTMGSERSRAAFLKLRDSINALANEEISKQQT